MKTVNILYDSYHPGIIDLFVSRVWKVQKEYGITINMAVSGVVDRTIKRISLVKEVKSNPNLDFIIVHIGERDNGDGTMNYDGIDECREFTDAKIIGESSSYFGEYGEFAEHFDGYLNLGMHTNHIESLLKKHNFISDEE